MSRLLYEHASALFIALVTVGSPTYCFVLRPMARETTGSWGDVSRPRARQCWREKSALSQHSGDSCGSADRPCFRGSSFSDRVLFLCCRRAREHALSFAVSAAEIRCGFAEKK